MELLNWKRGKEHNTLCTYLKKQDNKKLAKFYETREVHPLGLKSFIVINEANNFYFF